MTSLHTDKVMHQFSDVALNNLLQLLKKEVSDHCRHLNQYFQVFLNYSNKGPYEVSTYTLFVHTVKLNVTLSYLTLD